MSLGKIISMFPGGGAGLGLGALLAFMGSRGQNKGSMLPPGVNPETLETTDYAGDPGKYKPFVNTLTDERFATEKERDEDVARVQALLMENTRTSAEGGIISAYNLGGMASAAPGIGGLLRGPGTGTSDSIPGMIYQGGQPVQQAALSDGEFVFTNKAVKAAGGGSIEKGADAMYELMNNLERRA